MTYYSLHFIAEDGHEDYARENEREEIKALYEKANVPFVIKELPIEEEEDSYDYDYSDDFLFPEQ